MCGKKSAPAAPAPLPVAKPDTSIANRGSTEPTTVAQGKRISSTEGDGISGGLSPASPAPVAKSVLGG